MFLCCSCSSSCWHTSSCWPGLEWRPSPPCRSSYTSTSGIFAKMLQCWTGPRSAWTHASMVRTPHTHTHTHTHTDPAVQHLSHLCQTVDTAAFILLWGLFVSTSSAIFSHIKGNTFIKWATSDMKSCKRPTLKVMFSVLRFMIYSTISLFLFTLLSW